MRKIIISLMANVMKDNQEENGGVNDKTKSKELL